MQQIFHMLPGLHKITAANFFRAADAKPVGTKDFRHAVDANHHTGHETKNVTGVASDDHPRPGSTVDVVGHSTVELRIQRFFGLDHHCISYYKSCLIRYVQDLYHVHQYNQYIYIYIYQNMKII